MYRPSGESDIIFKNNTREIAGVQSAEQSTGIMGAKYFLSQTSKIKEEMGANDEKFGF